MTTPMFNQPSDGGGFFKPKEAFGHLILILRVHGIREETDTYGGQTRQVDIATVDLVDLDAAPYELRERVKVGNVGIVNRLVTGATNVLGRIGQIDSGKGNPAWVLNGFDPNSTDTQRAGAWLQAYQAQQFAAPAPAPQPAPQAAPAPQYAPAPAPAPQYAPVPQPAPQYVPQAQPMPTPPPAFPSTTPPPDFSQQPQVAAPPAAPAMDQAALAALQAQLGGQVIQQ